MDDTASKSASSLNRISKPIVTARRHTPNAFLAARAPRLASISIPNIPTRSCRHGYDRQPTFVNNNDSREDRTVGLAQQKPLGRPRINDTNETRDAANLGYVDANVNGFRIQTLLDTGASVSLCSERICNDIDRSSRGELKGVGG